MPVGSLCSACGAKLSGDVSWCARCLTPVRLYAAREPVHHPGSYVGPAMETPRTSRWRAGPTSFGPAGRVLATLALFLLFPWWGVGDFLNPLFLWGLMGWLMMAGVVLRNVWKAERIVGERPSRLDGFRRRHPLLGRELRLGPHGRTVLLLLTAACAVAAWVGLDDAGRYVWAVVAIVGGVGILLGSWNDL